MNTDIRYIFLDLGGTFRVIDKDPAYLAAARAKIAELCGVKIEYENPGTVGTVGTEVHRSSGTHTRAHARVL